MNETIAAAEIRSLDVARDDKDDGGGGKIFRLSSEKLFLPEVKKQLIDTWKTVGACDIIKMEKDQGSGSWSLVFLYPDKKGRLICGSPQKGFPLWILNRHSGFNEIFKSNTVAFECEISDHRSDVKYWALPNVKYSLPRMWYMVLLAQRDPSHGEGWHCNRVGGRR